jgi:acetyl-CoA acetyltransferase
MTAPDAVIVAATRSPIGRACKGSLVGVRPDDLAALMVRTVLDKIPALSATEVEDVVLGCGLPGGEQGYNIARVVAVLAGLRDVALLRVGPAGGPYRRACDPIARGCGVHRRRRRVCKSQ